MWFYSDVAGQFAQSLDICLPDPAKANAAKAERDKQKEKEKEKTAKQREEERLHADEEEEKAKKVKAPPMKDSLLLLSMQMSARAGGAQVCEHKQHGTLRHCSHAYLCAFTICCSFWSLMCVISLRASRASKIRLFL